ncbi:MAG: phosphohistidine phosphatase SixA [Candidatus Hydrogenedentota bacterium]
MRLYLVQHGEAMDKSENPDRPLTEAGRNAVTAVAKLLGNAGLKVPRIEHSGKTRARETAELLAEAVGESTSVGERKDISPNDPVDIVASSLRRADADLMLVGHLPFMSKLASLLVTGDTYAEVIAFQKGGVVCVERDEKGAWHIAWMVVPRLAGA